MRNPLKSKAPPYCHWKTNGRNFGCWYFERPGYPRVRVPGLPWTPEFMAVYEKATKAKPAEIGASRTVPRSLGAVIVAYYSSAAWRGLASSTKRTYGGVIEALREAHGGMPIAGLKREHIKKLIEKKALEGGACAANRLLSVLGILLDVALDAGLIETNPARTVKKLKHRAIGFHTWTEDEVAAFRAHWAIETRQRLAFELLLCTAQRSSDVRQMRTAQIAGGCVALSQQKTHAPLRIPLLPELQAALAAAPVIGAETALVTQYGRAFTEKGFGLFIKKACVAAGLTHCSAHGLRKAAARRLAEAGCTVHQIAAITGHATLREIERYTKEASQLRLAEAAFATLRGTSDERKV
ncbi:integrase family protein [Rhodomicrobium vannielii ATCC 17100]|uniref:Integrase family protein n=1 Tax=Rhodomicrobium vannielii (strain ATCC 17100 / DSM 162 / LMG 4299 / NCIMB 10020 / ATH 3.1.1) TaxID=648757 RepID=E3I853_RHOVT|nr:tyrosine-type recombinase/integrase [Rhodomicrobium vannielii]ADP71979.1 integrase family protein [Rhodomicrobium vannielii ATCC 17100]